MIGDIDESGNKSVDDEDLLDDDTEDDDDTGVSAIDDDDDDDDVDDDTTSLNVAELVAKLDATDPAEIARRRAIRQRLEELRELRESELDSTFNFNLDDDVD